MTVRSLDPTADRGLVSAVLAEAQDYYLLWKGRAPGPEETDGFFTDCPPGCDPAASCRLGLFDEGRLAGVAELSFGFPAPQDAYLGLMILAPWARGRGLGAGFLAHIEGLARSAGSSVLYLAVLEANPRGRAFWERSGFAATGLSRTDDSHARPHRIHRLAKPL